jgi:hypothetical protein
MSKFKMSRTLYLKQIMDLIKDDPTNPPKLIVVKRGAAMGATCEIIKPINK